jgi:N utilization substance protein B
MTKRRRAREFALQLLFQHEFTSKGDFKEFWQGKNVSSEVRDFAEALVLGTINNKERLDKIIREAAEHWALDRMAAVDRNILRMGAYEMLFRDDIPSAVAINEALEIAKKYAATESVPFINGILDKIAKGKKKV